MLNWRHSLIVLLGCFNSSVIASTGAATTPHTDAVTIGKPSASRAISANPGAVNVLAGTDEAQTYIEKLLHIHKNHGVRIGGMILADVNDLFSGGIPDAEKWTNNELFILDLSIDTEKFAGLKGGIFDVQFLQFNGQETNRQAGSVQGYNSLPGAPPLNRSELYQLWYRQALFNNKVILRIGKQVPTFDFNNVIKPVPLEMNHPGISAITGLLYTPIFVTTSMLGVLPGYYNSAYGGTINFTPVDWWYLSYGIYDGNLARGTQTGLTGPTFNGSYFNIAETGAVWLLGKKELPGGVGIGVWHQSGLVQDGSLSEHGADGYYLFGTQRLWYKNPAYDSSGITSFYQFGTNNSNVLAMSKYVGAGFTGFGLVPSRLNDSMGIGAAYSWLNQNSFSHRGELMYQYYYQAEIMQKVLYLEPAISYIPTPGVTGSIGAAWAGTMRAILLF